MYSFHANLTQRNFIKTYLIDQNIIQFNFNLTLPYYIFKLSPIQTLKQKEIKMTCNYKIDI